MKKINIIHIIIVLFAFFSVFQKTFSQVSNPDISAQNRKELTELVTTDGSIFSDSLISAAMIQNIGCKRYAAFTNFNVSQATIQSQSVNVTCPVSPAWCTTPCIEKGEIFIKLHAGGNLRTYEYGDPGGASWTVTCTLTVTKQPSGLQEILPLTISSSSPEQIIVKTLSASEFYQLGCSTNTGNLSSLSFNLSNIVRSTYVPDDVRDRLRAEILFVSTYSVKAQSSSLLIDLGAQAQGHVLSCGITNSPYIVANNPVTFKWTNNPSTCPDSFVNYQIQILRLYNNNGQIPVNDEEITTTVDWRKALTLETGAKARDITLTLAEGKGYYCWRVRPIGNEHPGGVSNPSNYGLWSSAPAQDAQITLGCATQNFGHAIFFYNGFDHERNWAYQRSFTESDNKGPRSNESMSYMNSLMQPVQNQVFNKTDNNVLISHSLYDYSGRKSFTSLAVPNNQPGLQYYTHPLGTVTQSNIDNPGLLVVPSPYTTSQSFGGGLLSYYNASTATNYNPPSNNTAFSRMRVGSDGRERELGSPGPNVGIGDAQSTRVDYAPILDQELVAVFGDEAPAATSVSKTLTTDPNGIINATYKSKDGNVLATCIVSSVDLQSSLSNGIINVDYPPNMKYLKGEKVNVLNSPQFVVLPSINTKSANENRAIMSKEFYVPNPSTITIAYDLENQKSFSAKRLSVGENGDIVCDDNYCALCDYIITIRVIRQETGEIVAQYIRRNTDDVFAQCSTKTEDIDRPLTFQENIALTHSGVYVVERTVTALNRTSSSATPPNTYLEGLHLDNTIGDVNKLQGNSNNSLSLENIYKSVFGSFYSNPSGIKPPEFEKMLYNIYRSDYFAANHPKQPIFQLGNCGTIYLPDVLCDFACKGGTNAEKSEAYEKFLYDELFVKVFHLPSDLNSYNSRDLKLAFCDYNGNSKISVPTTSGWFNSMIKNMLDCGYDCDRTLNIWKSVVMEYASSLEQIRIKNREAGEPEQVYLYMQPGNRKIYTDLYETFLDRVGRFKEGTIQTNSSCQFRVTSTFYDEQNPVNDYIHNGFRAVYHPTGNFNSLGCGEFVSSTGNFIPPSVSSPSTAQDLTTWLTFQKCIFNGLIQEENSDGFVKELAEDLKLPLDCIENRDPDCAKKFLETLTSQCQVKCRDRYTEFRKLYIEMMAQHFQKYPVGTERPNSNPITIVQDGDPDALYEHNIECAIAMLVADCEKSCDITLSTNPNDPPVSAERWARYRQVMSGIPEIAPSLNNIEGPQCPTAQNPSTPPFRKIDPVNTVDGLSVAKTLVAYLNEEFRKRYEKILNGELTAQTILFDDLACEYLVKLGITNPPQCVCDNDKLHIYIDKKSLPINFMMPEKGNENASCCDILLEMDVPDSCGSQNGLNFADRLNLYLNMVWGKKMPNVQSNSPFFSDPWFSRNWSSNQPFSHSNRYPLNRDPNGMGNNWGDLANLLNKDLGFYVGCREGYVTNQALFYFSPAVLPYPNTGKSVASVLPFLIGEMSNVLNETNLGEHITADGVGPFNKQWLEYNSTCENLYTTYPVDWNSNTGRYFYRGMENLEKLSFQFVPYTVSDDGANRCKYTTSVLSWWDDHFISVPNEMNKRNKRNSTGSAVNTRPFVPFYDAYDYVGSFMHYNREHGNGTQFQYLLSPNDDFLYAHFFRDPNGVFKQYGPIFIQLPYNKVEDTRYGWGGNSRPFFYVDLEIRSDAAKTVGQFYETQAGCKGTQLFPQFMLKEITLEVNGRYYTIKSNNNALMRYFFLNDEHYPNNNQFTSKIGYFSIDAQGYLVYNDRLANAESSLRLPNYEQNSNNLSVLNVAVKSERFYDVRFIERKVISLECEQTLCEYPLTDCMQFCVRYKDRPVFVNNSNPGAPVLPGLENDCYSRSIDKIKESIKNQYNQIIGSIGTNAKNAYRSACNAKSPNISDEITVTLANQYYYHYTLYYYDRAGNLVKTVPPKGVKIDPTYTRASYPPHTHVTEYYYNSLGQKIREKTPDGGESWFAYNLQGQLRASQTARQRAMNPQQFSFVNYDYIGRITESGVGDIPWTANSFTSMQGWSFSQNNTTLSPNNKKEITTLTYSTATPTANLPTPYNTVSPAIEQKNLRNRISKASYDADGAGSGLPNTTYYSYDPMGNVEWILQNIGGMKTPNGLQDAAVMIKYNYDLISGKVNRMDYRPGFPDQFYHRYEYDADNRLKQVFTSRDTLLWEQDAIYSYYPHGPLKRMVIGEDSVQGTDYVYTIHGWLKGINHPALLTGGSSVDPGLDGNTPSPVNRTVVARDAFGMVLGYYNNDFPNSSSSFKSHNAVRGVSNQMFNGNINVWTSNTLRPATNADAPANNNRHNGTATADIYTYDELNRLRQDVFYYHDGTSFTNTGDKYGNEYTYDENGNIQTLKRNGLLPATGAVSQMDNLTYNYSNSTTDNKLTSLTEAPTINSSDFADDLDAGQTGTNYQYDPSGNMIADGQEGLTIEWNAKGKVSKVIDANAVPVKTITFDYDANGNRVKKTVDNGSGACSTNVVTYYLYNEKGTLMATYKRTGCFQTPAPTLLADHTIQSHQRMGLRTYPQAGSTVQLNNVTQSNTQGYGSRQLFQKQYELSDQLGNVRAVISDAKWSVSGVMTPHILSYTNYYPFGMAQPGRNWSGSTYRYGYNGQEKDDELKGGGNSYNFEFRMHDPRVGRFLSLDPLAPKYPWNSPYSFAENRVIDGIELEGAEYLTITKRIYYGKPETITVTWHNKDVHDAYGKFGQGFMIAYKYFDKDGNYIKEKYHQQFYARTSWPDDYGIYMGSTSFKFKLYTEFGISPVSQTDYFAMLHDDYYDKLDAKGATSLSKDWGCIPADQAAIDGWEEVGKHSTNDIDPITGKNYTDDTFKHAWMGREYFKGVVWQKTEAAAHFFLQNFRDQAVPLVGSEGGRENSKYANAVYTNWLKFRDHYMIQDSEGRWLRNKPLWHNAGTEAEPMWVPIPPPKKK